MAIPSQPLTILTAPHPQRRQRIFLSPPHIGAEEVAFVLEAFEGNWIAPVGPNVDAFEHEFSTLFGFGHAAAVSSGTAALHLAARLLDIQRGDEVFCSSLTFVASACPIIYQNARPVFIDCDEKSWCMDPNVLAEALAAGARKGRLPKAVIVVDLYGQCADYDAILPICEHYEVPIIEDAAEALGATCGGRPAGAFGHVSAFSFNGNKIITTSGGGMLVSKDIDLMARARFLATQARDPAHHYEHTEVGFNYRLSNVLAGIGRGQLRVLYDRVAARRRNFDAYHEALSSLPGVTFMPEAPYGRSTRWLTCITVDPRVAGIDREAVRKALDAENVEARPVWKPLHLQPVFSGCRYCGGAVSPRLFEQGLCLPSGSNLTEDDLALIIGTIRGVFGA